MNAKTVIKGKIHYVGVNDRNKHLFEAMWPLPYGVSYNSYLIDDGVVALVDTVDVAFFETYLRKIREIIGDRPIQYLIINHMEPDHSGSISLIRKYYPDIVLVGNRQTFGMVEGFYGVAGERYEVKDGDFLDLGHHRLRFYLTPMVHWPETMMTYDETEHVLFSGDAFGCFGTVDGSCMDTRINLDKYWDEMVRYYANIVGKYGSPVQKALAKLSGLKIDTICSTHGPVWTENIGKVAGIYDRLSRYDAEEGVVIAYGSMYGNTEQMAELWAQGKELTEQNLAAFQYAQKNLLGLMYERPIVPHEAPQENILLCQAIIDCLEQGDVATAVDEYAWTVNNVLEWYAMYFSPEVIAVQDDMLWGEDNQDNLYWGTDIGFTKADVDEATRSIFARYDETGGDFSQEIAVYQAAIEAQTQILKDLGGQEISAMEELSDLLM